MPNAIPSLNIQSLDLGNIIRNVTDIQGAKTRNALEAEKLKEFRESKSARRDDARIAQEIQALDVSTKKLELANKTIDAMRNELVSISPQRYPSFLKKWSDVGVDVSNFEPPEQVGTDPVKWKAFVRDKVMTSEVLMEQLKAKIDAGHKKDIESAKQDRMDQRQSAMQDRMDQRQSSNTSPDVIKKKVMAKYLKGDEMTDREQQYIDKELSVAQPGGKQIIQTDHGYMIVNKNNPDYQEKLNINKPMTATQQDTVEKIKTLQDTIGQIEALYKKDYVGMVQGRKGAVATATGIGTDVQEQMFRAKTAELMKMVYALSGKQINQQEMERLRPFIPEVNDSDIAFETKVKAFKTQLNDVLANKLEVFVGETKSGGGGKPLPSVPASVIDARGDELEASGLTPEQVVAQLRAEGLLK
jgi:hypothetical protein